MTKRLEAMAMRLGLERHVVKECCEQNCKLALPNINNRLIVKADGVIVDKKACDCVIIYCTNILNIVIVELKSSRANYSSIKEKFDNTLEHALEWAHILIPRTQPRVRLILLAKTFTYRSSYQTLKNVDGQQAARRMPSRCINAATNCPSRTRACAALLRLLFRMWRPTSTLAARRIEWRADAQRRR